MKATLLKHYGKILLTILALGIGSYFNVDASTIKSVISALTPTSAPAPVPAPAATDPDAGL